MSDFIESVITSAITNLFNAWLIMLLWGTIAPEMGWQTWSYPVAFIITIILFIGTQGD